MPDIFAYSLGYYVAVILTVLAAVLIIGAMLLGVFKLIGLVLDAIRALRARRRPRLVIAGKTANDENRERSA